MGEDNERDPLKKRGEAYSSKIEHSRRRGISATMPADKSASLRPASSSGQADRNIPCQETRHAHG